MKSTQKLLELLGIKYPIIQAPMVGVSSPALAATVSNAGALGSIGIGASTVEKAEEMILSTRNLTSKPFNVNLFCHQAPIRNYVHEKNWINRLKPLFKEYGCDTPLELNEIYKSFINNSKMFEMLLEEKPPIISFHFGIPPAEWIQDLRRAGIILMGCVTNVHEALLVQQSGVDILIAQGIEAGGHRGVFVPARDLKLSTFSLIQQLISTNKIHLPIIAAGGIINGRAINSILQLGATGVQLGTAFILCHESAANNYYKNELKSEKSQKTVITSLISGRPARGLANRMVEMFGEISSSINIPDYPIAYDAFRIIESAAILKGDYRFSTKWAGQMAPLAREMSAKKLIDVLVQEWRESELNLKKKSPKKIHDNI